MKETTSPLCWPSLKKKGCVDREPVDDFANVAKVETMSMQDTNIQKRWPPNPSRTLSLSLNCDRRTRSKAALAAVCRVFRRIYSFCASGTQRVVQPVVAPPRFLGQEGVVAQAVSYQGAMAARWEAFRLEACHSGAYHSEACH